MNCWAFFVSSFLGLILAAPLRAENSCGALTAYRDNGLIQQWNSYIARKGKISEGVNDVRALEAHLHEDDWWTLSRIPEIASGLHLLADTIAGAVDSVSPGGNVVLLVQHQGPRTAQATYARFHQLLERGKQVVTIAEAKKVESEEMAALTWTLIVESTGQVGAATDSIKSVAEDLHNISTLSKRQHEYKSTLIEQSALLEQRLVTLNDQLDGLSKTQRSLNAVREAIDRLCGSNSSKPPVSSPKDLDSIYKQCRDAADPTRCVDEALKP